MIFHQRVFVIKTCCKSCKITLLQGQLQFKEGACDMPRYLHFLCEKRVRPVHLNLSLVITEKGGSENQEIRAEVLHGSGLRSCIWGDSTRAV